MVAARWPRSTDHGRRRAGLAEKLGSILHIGLPAAGEHTIVADFDAPGGNVWNNTLALDGVEVGSAQGWTCLFPMAPFEGIDVGLDRRSPVHWGLYEAHGAYPFTGRIDGVDYRPGPAPADSPNSLIEVLRQMGSKFE